MSGVDITTGSHVTILLTNNKNNMLNFKLNIKIKSESLKQTIMISTNISIQKYIIQFH